MDLGLANAAVVISGGSKGMGRAAAEAMAGEGARVAILARGRDALEDTIQSLVARGAAEAVGLTADLTNRAQVDAAFAEIGERWGELNVLVNAAGPVDVGVARRFDVLGDEEW